MEALVSHLATMGPNPCVGGAYSGRVSVRMLQSKTSLRERVARWIACLDRVLHGYSYVYGVVSVKRRYAVAIFFLVE